MGSITQASEELFRRTPDQTYGSFEELREHCQRSRTESQDHWVPADGDA